MESNHGGGIQQLLAAEHEAQQIVNAARTAKMTRLKQAKDEAETEIAEHKTSTEQGFQRKLEATSGDSGANVKRLEQETDAKIEQLKNEASRISKGVVEMLLKNVTTVNN
ncbi:PREDICTED: V-type proton ATPase subunit G2 [Camelina sativa]|uniref:V-type proton ATPase subunit G n=1 Tax=Camelina sativa TaxID=90675 RepID=A0ABM0U019_CAMSA|nr:PREDICTED: V-type proton ATPase subunit G2-like [Camelina sativa]XP_010448667.1 PREDICTED: V-type proton ATPase subunit G2 [Camelina sativa]